MALNLRKSGHRLVAYNRTRSRAEALAAQGALVADNIAEACRAEVVITMLSDDAAVEPVVFQSGGILSALPKNAIHVSMSTISLALSHRLAEEHGNARPVLCRGAGLWETGSGGRGQALHHRG